MAYDQYSPGAHKLMHHLGHLEAMVAGKPVAPIHVSVWPTIRCQLRCSYCCCRNVVDRTVGDIDKDEFMSAVDVLAKYGTKAIEFSGGGEPLLWPHLYEASKYVASKGIKLSLITNGLALKDVPLEVLSLFAWIRVSLHSVGHAKSIDFDRPRSVTRASASYIVSASDDLSCIPGLAAVAAEKRLTLRIAVERPSTLERELEVGNSVGGFSPPLFFSHKESGAPLGCYMAWVRAAINWKGMFLPCPAMQLNYDSTGAIPESFPLCHISGLEEWILKNPPRDLGYRCGFCNCGKEHNDLIHSLSKEEEDVDFV